MNEILKNNKFFIKSILKSINNYIFNNTIIFIFPIFYQNLKNDFFLKFFNSFIIY